MTDESTPMIPTLTAVLQQAVARPDADPELTARIAAVTDYLSAASDESSAPFLSVIVRTQGLRIEPFKDVLLCLQAQSTSDFEVIVVVHNADPEHASLVREAVSAFPASFRERVRVIDVEGGSRSRPLNVGLEHANGRYLSFYDDDDIVFAHWVESFVTGAKQSPGVLLRAVVANQPVEPEVWARGVSGLRSAAWPRPEWDDSFDLVGHLVVNKSPFMSWAFPRTLFSTLGVRFDEELVAAEDWDVILQGALMLGVADVPELTSIYRRWTNAESSYTAHSGDDWRQSEQRVIDRINAMVLTLPPGNSVPLRQQVLFAEALHHYRFLFKGHQLRQPLLGAWKAAAPGMRLAVRVRDKVRRMRSR